MSYHAPKLSSSAIQDPLPPVINMAQQDQALQQDKKKTGYLSSFLTEKRADLKPTGVLASTLGKTNI